MSTNTPLFPTDYMEVRLTTHGLQSVIVYRAETNKTFNDVFSSMADFMKSEITLIKQHKEEMQILFPSLYVQRT